MVLSFGHSTHHVPICWSRHVKTGQVHKMSHVGARRFPGADGNRSPPEPPWSNGSAFSKANHGSSSGSNLWCIMVPSCSIVSEKGVYLPLDFPI